MEYEDMIYKIYDWNKIASKRGLLHKNNSIVSIKFEIIFRPVKHGIIFPYQILSIIELGIDIFLPTTLTISLHTTSLTPSIAFVFSRRSRIEPLSLTIASTLKSIVCSPMLLATYVTSSEVSNLLATAFTIPFLMDIKKS